MPYPLAPPQGWKAVLIFENLAFSQSALRILQTLKTSPLINTDDTNQKSHRRGRRCHTIHASLRQSGMAWDAVG